jgi:hypothetical protein
VEASGSGSAQIRLKFHIMKALNSSVDMAASFAIFSRGDSSGVPLICLPRAWRIPV